MTKVMYHSTDVVSFNDSKIILNTGGWRSNTTKTRMNQTSNQFGLGYMVYQSGFQWFVEYKGDTISFIDSTMELSRQPKGEQQ